MMWLFIISFLVKLELEEWVLVEEGEPENTNIDFAALSQRSRTDCEGNPHTTPLTRFWEVLLTLWARRIIFNSISEVRALPKKTILFCSPFLIFPINEFSRLKKTLVQR